MQIVSIIHRIKKESIFNYARKTIMEYYGWENNKKGNESYAKWKISLKIKHLSEVKRKRLINIINTCEKRMGKPITGFFEE